MRTLYIVGFDGDNVFTYDTYDKRNLSRRYTILFERVGIIDSRPWKK